MNDSVLLRTENTFLKKELYREGKCAKKMSGYGSEIGEKHKNRQQKQLKGREHDDTNAY